MPRAPPRCARCYAGRIVSPYTLPDGNVQIAFSGGRTSGMMLHHILEANGPLPDRVRVVFSNTGREMPETLDFVAECGERWGVPIVWVEYDPDERYRVVTRETAATDGEPFEALIRKRKYLPNGVARFCTQELKIRPTTRLLVDSGWEHWHHALGIRADEQRRVRPSQDKTHTRWFPLVDAGATRHDVEAFWREQPFDLRLDAVRGETLLGNCDGCFLKSERRLSMLARDYPERHAWWERMEDLASELTSNPHGATWRKNGSRREIREYVERQGDWIFDTEDALCQRDGGECTDI